MVLRVQYVVFVRRASAAWSMDGAEPSRTMTKKADRRRWGAGPVWAFAFFAILKDTLTHEAEFIFEVDHASTRKSALSRAIVKRAVHANTKL
eukprot:3878462-Prymnesium_polylepis.2